MFSLDSSQFELIRSLSWEEVLDIWRKNEASNPFWITHYRNKGFSSWDEWRNATHAPVKGNEREWYLYKIVTPLAIVPTFRGGPFKSWKKQYFRGKASPSFSELVQHPGLQHDDTLEKLLANFPKTTTISGLMVGGDIYIMEGMHRCCALALAAQRNLPLTTELFITLAKYPESTLSELGTDGKQ